MVTEKDTIRCEAIFNEEHTHRFLWKRIWNKDKPVAAIIMLNPSQSDNIVTDTTTTLVVNNIARLERYGGVEILNLYSLLTNKLNFRWNSDEDLNDPENDDYIRKASEECSEVIVAWGKSADTNKRLAERAKAVVELLRPQKSKIFMISDGERMGLHPLTPSLRNQWIITPFDWAGHDKALAKATAEAEKQATETTKSAAKSVGRKKGNPAAKEAEKNENSGTKEDDAK